MGVYRIWDKKHECFVDEPYYGISSLGTVQIEGHSSVEPKRYIVNLCSTLPDMATREMYVGDIIEWSIWPYDDRPEVSRRMRDVVTFERGVFTTARRKAILANVEPYRNILIIGNIHENPDFLPPEPKDEG